MLEKRTIAFLKNLAKNNDREWFQDHKKAFESAQDNIVAMTSSLIGSIGRFDPSVSTLDPKSCVFRIYRDIRFSKDKSPYKTNLGAFIAPGGRKSMAPGYYFHLQPASFFSAAGKHMPDSHETLRIRTAIANNTGEFLKIVKAKKFVERFGEFHGDSLVKAPKGFDPEHAAIEFLKLKSFTVGEEFSEKQALSNDYLRVLNESFKASFPFISFLRSALK